ncbi:MAG: phosphatidate cytidylyltransferase, partial [Treponema sp.]|nr:phosphatidate cytidylyltransferase [Treponema sp.]
MSDHTPDAAPRRMPVRGIYKELFRKSIHLCSAVIPTVLYRAYVPTLVCLGAAVVVYSICEYIRRRGGTVPIVSKITETAARERDDHRFVGGPVTLVFGIILAAVLLPPLPARIGIYALSFGDGLASLVGRLCGRVHIPGTHGKTVAGSVACFVAVLGSSYAVCR